MYPTTVEWYALYTRSRFEQKVADSLEGKEFEVFLPKIKAWSRRRDRKLRIEKPLFPGYLFVRTALDPERRLAIVKTPGVVRILGYDREPAPVPAEQIESLLLAVKSGQDIEPHPYLKVGDKVRVISGPLRDAVGIVVEKQDKKRRLILSVDVMNQAVSVSLDACDIEPYR
ncbi:MAG: UpxY family transcription antiterminator [Abditibacteriales bacterium]|nr:UpxY family transcription antiterminator [Abditibacteriales bacterium]MDW8366714.1 UpxY family transcription antiterminator [Abditibacteriales bacterium]